MSVIRIGLAIFCMLLCTFAFLLPERSAFSFNLDYLDYLNSRRRMAVVRRSASPSQSIEPDKKNNLSSPSYPIEYVSVDSGGGVFIEDVFNEALSGQLTRKNNFYNYVDDVQAPLATTGTRFFTSLSNFPNPSPSSLVVLDSALAGADLLAGSPEECETKILANTLIKKINCENHCKTGKLNPLYEEECVQQQQQQQLNQSQLVGQLISTISNGIGTNLQDIQTKLNKNVFINESSTKF